MSNEVNKRDLKHQPEACPCPDCQRNFDWLWSLPDDTKLIVTKNESNGTVEVAVADETTTMMTVKQLRESREN